jgi:Spy/CpxP family protein refolding chaperone
MEANRPDQATMEEMRTLGKAKHDGTLTTEQEARLSTLWAQSKEKRQGIHQQILAVLTPDQLAKLEQKKQERKQRREQHQRQDQQSPTTQDN